MRRKIYEGVKPGQTVATAADPVTAPELIRLVILADPMTGTVMEKRVAFDGTFSLIQCGDKYEWVADGGKPFRLCV